MTTERQDPALTTGPDAGQGEATTAAHSPAPKRRSRKARAGLWVLLTFGFIGIVGTIAALSLSERAMHAPDWLKNRIEARLSEALPQGEISLGEVSLTFALTGAPKVRILDLGIINAFGADVARFDRVDLQMAAFPLIRGETQLRQLALRGGSLRMRRISDGTFDLALGLQDDLSARGSLAEVLTSVEQAFESSALRDLKRVTAFGVSLRFEDDLAERVFRIEAGRLNFTRPDGRMRLQLGFGLKAGEETTDATLVFETNHPVDGLSMRASFGNLRPRDFAATTPALAWASQLDAAVTGAARLGFDAEGHLSEMSGSMNLGEGTFEIEGRETPLEIEGGETIFSLVPEDERLNIDAFELATSSGRIAAGGHVFVSDGTLDRPDEVIGQIQITSAEFEPQGLLSEPVSIASGAVDFRMKLDPMVLDLGLMQLDVDGHQLTSQGHLAIDEAGTHAGFDLSASTLSRDALMAFWPLAVSFHTREWIDTNLIDADLRNVNLGLRWAPEERPKFATSFEFENVAIRYLKTLPVIENAKGRGVVQNNAFTLALDKGDVTAPNGDKIKLTRSLMEVPDLTVVSPPAIFTMHTDSSVTAALSLLDEPPFKFLTSAEMATDIFQGRARLRTELRLPLANKVGLDQIGYGVKGQVTNASSTALMADKTLVAERLEVAADPSGVTISGPATLGGAAFQGAWRQDFGRENKGKSRFDGRVTLDEALLSELSVGLPKGSFQGAGTGALRLDITKGAPVKFALNSDLNRIGLSIPALGWSKPRNRTGSLEISGLLGTTPRIDSLSLNAAGLSAKGAITLNTGGGLKTATFSRVALGGWLDAALTLTGRGKNRSPAVSVTGGMIDIRKTSLGAATGGAQGDSPISLALERLQVSDGIAITQFSGKISQSGGLSGQFKGRVNGGQPIQGTLAPGGNGTALRLRSNDAGAVLNAAGVLKNVRGGEMDLILTPRKEKGSYTGRLTVGETRLVGASAMAELLNAISVVGLIDALNGPGILFGNVEADFVLSPTRVILTKSSAVGPSMGISLDGIYDLGTRQMDMQGVVSPLYALNGIGQIFTRQGEGLFGFNFTLRGAAEKPQVQVNPLSIMTPGLFREIFRRPPPKVQN